ncbi:hypothetical protein CPB86DRAFT_697437 [Serendipita vermifera]|nr:hypothetical protein CPB86DRAFT_697437 [Serendipita vermifera]
MVSTKHHDKFDLIYSAESWVPAIDHWLTGLCSQPTCTNETVQAALQNITQGCSQELVSINLGVEDIANITAALQEYASHGRGVTCLVDTNGNSTWCITETLQRVEEAIGRPLNRNSLISQIPLLYIGSSGILSPNVSCTDCTRAAYAITSEYLPVIGNDSSISESIVQECGEGFINNGYPFNIQDRSYEATASVLTTSATATALTTTTTNTGSAFSTKKPKFSVLNLSLLFLWLYVVM